MLAKRLVGQLSASDDSEELVISKLREACGFEYSSKLQRMFQDIRISTQLTTEFKEHCKTNAYDIIDSFRIMVLHSFAWPLISTPACSLPHQLQPTYSLFTEFYTEKHTGRKLELIHQHSKGELQTLYTKQKYILQVSTYQMAILLLFNKVDNMTVKSICDRTQIKSELCRPILLVLLKSQVLKCSEITVNEELKENDIKDDYMIQVDENFKCKRDKINLNQAVKSVEQKEAEKDGQAIEEERNFLIQAAIVRTMKARKQLNYNSLTEQILPQLTSKFQPQIPMIKIAFYYIHDKDVFQRHYGKMLAKRLVGQLSASNDSEELVISKLREACGFEYSSKLQRMFQDIPISTQLTTEFKKHCKTKGYDIIDGFRVMVLHSFAWPFRSSPAFNLPHQIQPTYTLFTEFYTEKHSGRKLELLHQHSKGELQMLYTKSKYILQVSTYQMAILLLFNKVESITVNGESMTVNIKKAQIELKLFRPILLVLIKSQVLKCSDITLNEELKESDIEDDYMIQVDENFKSKRDKINLNQAVKSVEQKEAEKDGQAIEEERNFLIQAAIVRTMKARKQLNYNSITEQILPQLTSKFQPKISMIKTLTTLDVGHNEIAKVGAQHLGDALQYNTVTVILSSSTTIGDVGLQYLAAGLRHNATLTTLNLARNGIDGVGAQYLGDALQHNTTLTTLNLSGNGIREVGAQHLAAGLRHNTTLTTLYLQNNGIGDVGAQYLADALQQNTTLTTLNLAGCRIREVGAQHLATGLRQNTTLTTLDLWENEIGDDVIHEIDELVAWNKSGRKR
ncbi:unnamed protein product [Adineta steineri]|uniref:Cullin family profile domain-containing protein n=1 Tax=Adineta steineri TaxID=433720 RepID=A0A813TBG9_9BILA|nr:unnamed protein product [Adineta steineri]